MKKPNDKSFAARQSLKLHDGASENETCTTKPQNTQATRQQLNQSLIVINTFQTMPGTSLPWPSIACHLVCDSISKSTSRASTRSRPETKILSSPIFGKSFCHFFDSVGVYVVSQPDCTAPSLGLSIIEGTQKNQCLANLIHCRRHISRHHEEQMIPRMTGNKKPANLTISGF